MSTPHTQPPALRACDRCWRLKTQCDFQAPCRRCRRLQLPCVSERPARPKGRPKRPASLNQTNRDPSSEGESGGGQDAHPLNVSSKPLASSHEPFALALDSSLIESLLQQFLSSTQQLGIFSILPGDILLRKDAQQDVSHWTLSEESRRAVLAISLEVYHYRLPSVVAAPLAANKHEYLHTTAQSLISYITLAGSQPQMGNAILMLLMSYTWCLNTDYIEMSSRWYSLSCLMFEESSKGTTRDVFWAELSNRTERALYAQDAILALLQYSRNSNCPLKVYPMPRVVDSTWHASALSTRALSNPQPAEESSFFSLMEPLFNCMRAVLEDPLPGSRRWTGVKNQLSYYFFDFPPALLRLDHLSYAYEAEAMIWMHGLFIILYGTRDLVDLLMDPVYLECDRFSHLLDHALLLGDIIPTLLALDPYLHGLSPATVLFVVYSATVHALALRQFFPSSTDNTNRPAFLETSVPAKLLRSSDHHRDMLSAIDMYCKRYNILILNEIHSLLSYTLSRAAFRAPGPTTPQFINMRTLMYYRWRGQGTGVIPLSQEDADAEWRYPVSPDEAPLLEQYYLVGAKAELQRVAVELCAADARMCQNGYFDLSIVFP